MENLWYHRKVADTSAKACTICFKSSTSVLITPDSKDFFYICPGHLKDRNFALPTEEEAKAMEERKKKEEMDKEIEKIKAEYEEKLKKKQDKKKGKDDKKGEKKDEDKTEEQLEKEKQDKINAVGKQEAKVEDGPRIFRLQKHFYNMRLEKKRTAEMAKRNQERLRNPSTFPSVPTGTLGGNEP
ncbi:VPS4-associated protein 1 [Elsinoe ampelina]|uniref:VPS4-associated protein 1 n=1 Tax=Elsinoe ampelina TaxID=302913 RepID=A0A6A6GCQ3_9PEZI|nr:VPS4-associated protein 1 [Elsinoe ampelina]